VLVGISRRTNREGYEQFAGMLPGYGCRPVEVSECLHLKTAVCYLGEETMLANTAWVDREALHGFRVLEAGEPWGANVISIGGTVLMPEGFPETRKVVEGAGFRVRTLDISELMKAEAGLTCMSLLFNATGKPMPS
jgi:dimethylargininase